MADELKACPFCGQTEGVALFKEPEQAHGGGVTYAFVRCSCSACGPRFDDWDNRDSVQDAINAWNGRKA